MFLTFIFNGLFRRELIIILAYVSRLILLCEQFAYDHFEYVNWEETCTHIK